ncbi:MAG TPA: class I SAM-dependent methyltransferase [Ideonella sp.]|uniref:class I SAM-dependent methyltransferase n=1 Tax=Ideonella sp. TaxID=1929293 RepID=UPI002C8C7D5E|nr:class I SAM-dependent methyltransferase [Ideonella sp.]HSI47647.1 class I SAM-dependent methyltransferase [Ideonella sp.]
MTAGEPTEDAAFYDALAPLYHLVYPDWPASVRRQGEQLSALMQREWPRATPQRRVLDLACGIGTQALGLAQQGHAVTASDLSPGAVARAREEAAKQGLDIAFSVADMRQAHTHHGGGFDAVLCADNSLPHLLTEADLRQALQQMHDCLSPGGGCVISLRDYAAEPRGRGIVKPYGVREQDGKRFLLFQVWDFESRPAGADGAPQADLCHIAFFFVEEDQASQTVQTHVMRSVYHAVSIDTLLQLMRAVGFLDVRRLDDVFYQPVLVGLRMG